VGSFLFNSIWDEEETKNRFPDHMKKTFAEQNINVYIINATKIAEEIGLVDTNKHHYAICFL
jgi:pyruvate-ferredoxin/flavodoxin oxidoreductase